MSWPHRFVTWLIGEPFRDARGRRVRVAFLGGYPAALWSRMHKLPPDVHRRVRSRCWSASSEYLFPSVLFGAFLIVIVVLLWIALSRLLPRNAPLIWTTVMTAVSQLLIMVPMIWYGERRTAAVKAKALLEDQYCPSCRYTLRGVPGTADGCVICPECGAVWRMHGPCDLLDDVIRGLADADDTPTEIARRVGRSITEVEHALDRTASRSTSASPPTTPSR